MIVVLGRPALAVPSSVADGAAAQAGRLAGLAALIAVEAAARGSSVEVAGSIGDDAEGDRVAVELGKHHVGHAALLRDPAGSTPVAGREAGAPSAADAAPPPRLEAGDVELGLRYLTEYHVLVLAQALPVDAEAAALDAAAYHGAAVVAIVAAGASAGSRLAEEATVLEEPSAEAGTEDEADASVAGNSAFAAFIGAFAARLDAGQQAADALREAASGTGWQRSSAG